MRVMIRMGDDGLSELLVLPLIWWLFYFENFMLRQMVSADDGFVV